MAGPDQTGHVVAVSRSQTHSFTKKRQQAIHLEQGLGVVGDAHHGPLTLDPRAKDKSAPNVRQIHLLASERLAELQAAGFALAPGQIGENVTTTGIDLHSLPLHTKLFLGDGPVVQLTGLRNPCSQLSKMQKGLTRAMLERREDGKLMQKAGVLGVVAAGGDICEGDSIRIELPDGAHEPLPVL